MTSQRTDCDAARVVQGLEARVRAQAKRNGIHVSFAYEDNAWFASLGQAQDVHAGIEALMQGLVGACARFDRLHIEVHKYGDSASIEASCDRQILSGKSVFFGVAPDVRQADASDQVAAYLQCAVALLMLRAEQIRIHTDYGQRILIDL